MDIPAIPTNAGNEDFRNPPGAEPEPASAGAARPVTCTRPVTRARPVISGACGLLCLASVAAFAVEPAGGLTFHLLPESDLFTPHNQTPAPSESKGGTVAIRASVETGDTGGGVAHSPGLSSLANLDHLISAYQSQGLKINRLSTAWETGSGTLTVGNDWTNFQDFLLPRHGGGGHGTLLDGKPTAEQIAWAGRDGFSIALETPDDGETEAANDDIESLRALTDGSPNLILSWQSGLADDAGRYKVSVLGRKLELKGRHNGVPVEYSELGWGVKLAGGWHFGDLFAALSVTLGNGIDSLLLKRFGSDVAVSPSGRAKTLESLSILPSLNYSIGEHSDLHVALGRYQSKDGEAIEGVDTLDTINLGYTWSPWPSTQFGVEVVRKDFEGAVSDEDSAEIKFGAERRF